MGKRGRFHGLKKIKQFASANWNNLPLLAVYSVIVTVVVASVHYYHGPVANAPAVPTGSGYRSNGTVLSGSWIEKRQKAADDAAALAAAEAAVAAAKAKLKLPPQHIAATATTGFGISFGDTLPWISASALDSELKDTAAMGFTNIRMDFDWMNMQPDSASSFNWSDHDRVVKTAAKYKLKVLGLITYTPAWARPAGCGFESCAPANNSQYAAFAAAAAAHYAPLGVHNWELWNEPNLQGSWRPSPSAAAYADLLKLTYSAIKNVNPNAFIISGGISSVDNASGSVNQLTFLSSMYSAGARGSFDALGYHSYSFPATPDEVHSWSGWSMMNALPTSLSSIMTANGDGAKKIWSTEYGAPTNGPGAQATESGYDPEAGDYYVSEGLQAKMAAQAINAVRAGSWAGPLFWYSYKDLGTDTSTSENFFGILRADGSRKPIYGTFQSMLK